MSEPFLGEIQMFGFNFPPRGWAHCDGQILPINQNQALFSLLGTTYGGDGRTTFALPDLRGRTSVHPGQGAGLSNIVLGQKFGATEITLATANLPPHSHTVRCKNDEGNSEEPAGHFIAQDGEDGFAEEADASMANDAVTNTGGGQPLSIRNPYLGIYHAIALVGIFPSRN